MISIGTGDAADLRKKAKDRKVKLHRLEDERCGLDLKTVRGVQCE